MRLPHDMNLLYGFTLAFATFMHEIPIKPSLILESFLRNLVPMFPTLFGLCACIIFCLFLGGHHLYLNFLFCLSVCNRYVRFSVPLHLVRFSAPPQLTGAPGHWDTWTTGQKRPTL